MGSKFDKKPQADALVIPKIAPGELRVGGEDADVQGFNNQSIQFAIDALAQSGGRVLLDPGTYRITAPVRMKSGVHLSGAGQESILKRGTGVQTRYVVDADYGELKLTVENSDGFLKIPMHGFTESYNISVAAALVLFTLTEKLRQSDLKWQLSEEEKLGILLDWTRKSINRSEIIEAEFLKSLKY